MKKLLIMASLFWPQKNSGGPPISIMNLVKSIKDFFDIYIISKNHEIHDDKPLEGIVSGWNEFDFGKAIYLSREEHTMKRVERIIEEINPDVIYQNSFFSFDDILPVLLYKKRHRKVKVIVAPRGEFYPERIQVGKTKKYIYGYVFRISGLLNDVYFQGTGKEECDQTRKFLRISDEYLLNVQNISIRNKMEYKQVEKTCGHLRLVYIARIHPTKNTLKAIELLSTLKDKIVYDIYGSIENVAYWEKCKDAISKLPENITISYLGVVDHEQVERIIEEYHAYYMPTTGENFGHSIVEAMLLGKPVVISDQTPWTDVNGNGGYAIPLTNDDGFRCAISELAAMDMKKYLDYSNKIEEYIKKKLSIEDIIQQYIDAFSIEK